MVDADDYSRVLKDMASHDGAVSQATRFDLAIKAFEHTAAYDAAIANYFGQRVGSGEPDFPRTLSLQFSKKQGMRYGEEPAPEGGFLC